MEGEQAMSERKKLILTGLLGAVILGVGSLPGLILGQVQHYQVLSPQTVSYRSSIRCEGTVYPGEGYDLLASGLYRVEESYVSLGNQVKEGQLLAKLRPVDQSHDPVLYLQTQGRGLSGLEEDAGLAALAQAYGLESSNIPELGTALLTPGSGEGKEVSVLSPVTGTLTKEIPLPGSVVKPGAVICGVEGKENPFALLTVSEKDAAALKEGNEVILAGEGVGLVACSGVLTKIYPGTRKELNGTAVQRVVDVEVAILGENGNICPGFGVKAQIFTDDERQIMILPYESVKQDDTDNSEYVMVAGKYRLEKRPITTGLETLDGVEILSGLSPGELVTVENGASDSEVRYFLERWVE